MIGYVSVGVDDMAAAKAFYLSFLPALGYAFTEGSEGLSFEIPVPDGEKPISPDFYVKPPFNGEPASTGNGTMVAFEAKGQQQVRDLHAAALAAGGTNEGAPGFRADYSAHFFVAYLRDPQGNKIALYSSDQSEPGRDD